jgi:hypothetical protein
LIVDGDLYQPAQGLFMVRRFIANNYAVLPCTKERLSGFPIAHLDNHRNTHTASTHLLAKI